MRNSIIAILVCMFSTALAQERIFLYPSTQKVTIDGFKLDSLPPYIDRYLAPKELANGAAILVCPGGGYGMLADKHEGSDVARFYNQQGFEAFVLHYRLNNGAQQGHRYPDQYNDVTTAMRLIKSKSKGWGIDPNRLGIIGFSAGGHLASMATTIHLDPVAGSSNPLEQWSSRPAFSILIYPVITLSGPPTHGGSRNNLLGLNPSKELIDSLSTQNRVNAKTPPTFLVYSNDDTAVPPENGILFYQALRKYAIPASLHVYDHGGHGYGMAPDDKVLNTWPALSVAWLVNLGITKH